MNIKYFFLRYTIFRDEVLIHYGKTGWRSPGRDFYFFYGLCKLIVWHDLFRFYQFAGAEFFRASSWAGKIKTGIQALIRYDMAWIIRAIRHKRYHYTFENAGNDPGPQHHNVSPQTTVQTEQSILLPDADITGFAIVKYAVADAVDITDISLWIDGGSGFDPESRMQLPVLPESEILVDLPLRAKSMELRLQPASKAIQRVSIEMRETNIIGATRYLCTIKKLPLADALYALLVRLYPWVIAPPSLKSPYHVWVHYYDTSSDCERKKMRRLIRKFAQCPHFTLMVKVDSPDIAWINQFLQSMQNQTYPHWSLILYTSAANPLNIEETIGVRNIQNSRISIEPAHEIKHWNHVRQVQAPTAEYVVYIDRAGCFPEHALFTFAKYLNEQPAAEIVYTDHDEWHNGARRNPHFKPDWNYDFFLQQDYIGSPVLYQANRFNELIARLDIEQIDNYALLLKSVTPPHKQNIMHIPQVLFHMQAGVRVFSYPGHADQVRQHLAEAGSQANITPLPCIPEAVRIQWPLPEPAPLVSIIIPTRNQKKLLSSLINGLQQQTDYSLFEIIIVNNRTDEPEALDYLQALKNENHIRILDYPHEFNFSAMMNHAAQQANGSYLALMNNDVSIIHSSWLREMVSICAREDVGIVGAKLYHPEGTVQHAGMITGLRGCVRFPFNHYPNLANGYMNRLQLTQEVSCVAGACFLIRTELYKNTGGMDEVNFPVTLNEIDLCMKIRALGYKIIWTPHARLYHIGSATRDLDFTPEGLPHAIKARDHFLRVWSDRIYIDPFFNPNLSLMDDNISLAFPPRIRKPWLASTR